MKVVILERESIGMDVDVVSMYEKFGEVVV